MTDSTNIFNRKSSYAKSDILENQLRLQTSKTILSSKYYKLD